MGALIVLVGLPGSGKSTYAKKLNGVIVSTDEIRKELYGGESITYSEEIAQQLWKIQGNTHCTEEEMAVRKQNLCIDYIFEVARQRCCDLLRQGETVIYDSTNHKKKYRTALLTQAKGLYTRAEAHFLNVPLETVLKQNRRRSRQEPDDLILEISEYLVPPTLEEGFDVILEL